MIVMLLMLLLMMQVMVMVSMMSLHLSEQERNPCKVKLQEHFAMKRNMRADDQRNLVVSLLHIIQDVQLQLIVEEHQDDDPKP